MEKPLVLEFAFKESYNELIEWIIDVFMCNMQFSGMIHIEKMVPDPLGSYS